MGYNRGGTRRKARLKRRKREEMRLANAAESQNPAAPPAPKRARPKS